jgi:alpha-glucosidase
VSRPHDGAWPPTNWERLERIDSVYYESERNSLVLQTDNHVMDVSLLNLGGMRLCWVPEGAERLPSGVLDECQLGSVPLTLQAVSDGWSAVGGERTIHIQRRPFVVTFYVKTRMVWQSAADGIGRLGASVWGQVPLSPEDRVFGLGEKTGVLNKRPGRWQQWTTDEYLHTPAADPLYLSIPWVIVHRGQESVGIFLANSHRAYFDVGSTEPSMLSLGADGGALDLFICPGTLPQILEQYTALTGRAPMPPIYALGFQQSRYSYKSAEEVLAVAQKFRELDLPCDLIYLDIDYMDGYRVFTWNPQKFPNPSDMLRQLEHLAIGVVPIIDPGVKVDPTYAVYQSGQAGQHFLHYRNGAEFHSQVWPGTCAFPDFAQSRTRAWWANLHQPLITDGVAGIWNDMNEPAWSQEDGSSYGRDSDADVVHHDDDHVYTHSAVHNLYGLWEAQATFAALATVVPESTVRDSDTVRRRPFILSRSGFAGIQRYAAVWTGDNCSWWEHLALAIPMCLNLGLSGVPFVGVDVGGFQYNATPELYTRWVQMGIFFPLLRAHSANDTNPHEPWSFGAETLNIVRTYLHYRYRLLPYWYALFYESSQTGAPPMRPLVWDYPWHNDAISHVDDQFLVGSFLLVAPILHAGHCQRSVAILPGVWHDVCTGQEIVGPQTVVANAPLDRIPLYVRAGSIIPLAPRVRSTRDWPVPGVPHEYFVIRGTGHFRVYADDGLTTRYQSGDYCVIEVMVQTSDTATIIQWVPLADFPNVGETYVVHVGYYSTPPRQILSRGRALVRVRENPGLGQWDWNPATRRVSMVVLASLRQSDPLTVRIEQ